MHITYNIGAPADAYLKAPVEMLLYMRILELG
jgi:hypothetical protein